MNLNLAVDGGSVEVADTDLAGNIMKPSCIKLLLHIWPVLVRDPARRKIAPR